jgi:hypothetical protein
MTKSNFIFVDSVLFLLIGGGHLIRALMGWEVTVGHYVIPVWLSWVSIIISIYLAFQGFLLSKAG